MTRKNRQIVPIITFTLLLIFLLSALVGCIGTSEIVEKLIPLDEPLFPLLIKTNEITIKNLQEAFSNTVASQEDVVGFLIYQVIVDHIDLSKDKNLALIWYAFIDPESYEVVPGELGLAIGINEPGADGGERWEIYLQSDPEWVNVLAQVPEELMQVDKKDRYLPDEQPQQKGKAFKGYRLPWPAGRRVKVTGSIGHVFTYKTCPNSCLYAFDFSDGTMFPVHAAKAGRVKYAVWKFPDGYKEQGNYLVLEDTTTNPTTYQVYYHLAQDSIPAKLRVIGAQVYQGQFIGRADNTGPSSGHHLHFHVHTNKSMWWGNSVDITFDDVETNGGRPRTCAEARMFSSYGDECQKGDWYTSSNGDYEGPKGGIDSPKKDTNVTEPILAIKGWGKDDTGISSMQLYWFKENEWRPLGPTIAKAKFTSEIDLCKNGVPLGPFLIGLQVIDQAGKVTKKLQGMRTLNMEYDCNPPPPPCFPDSDQIAIYEDVQHTGYCVVLDKGKYPSLESLEHVKGNNTASIKVGSDVMVLAYEENDYGGKREVIIDDDLDLSDNDIGVDAVSSLIVQDLIQTPQPPMMLIPRNGKGLPVTVTDEVMLSWDAVPDIDDYRGELTGPRGYKLIMDWQTDTEWNIGRLDEGTYVWTLVARNILGESQASLSFSVQAADVASSVALLPLEDTQGTTAIRLSWKVISGESDLERFEIQYRVDGGKWKDWDQSLPTHLREALFWGKTGKIYEFRIRSIDLAGNVEEYPDEPEERIEILECEGDAYEEEIGLDNEVNGATPIDIGRLQKHNLCEQGDVDWFVFPGRAGQKLSLTAKSKLDQVATIIQLYSSNGETLLGEGAPSSEENSTRLVWTVPMDGFYYMRIQARDDKMAGGDVEYTVKINNLGSLNPIPIACSSLLLPVLWYVVKYILRKPIRTTKAFDPVSFN